MGWFVFAIGCFFVGAGANTNTETHEALVLGAVLCCGCIIAAGIRLTDRLNGD